MCGSSELEIRSPLTASDFHGLRAKGYRFRSRPTHLPMVNYSNDKIHKYKEPFIAMIKNGHVFVAPRAATDEPE